MQNKLSKGNLLDEKGQLCESGYATSLVKDYDREAIKANKMRIKEWDYYLVYNDHYGVALTIDDNSYMGLDSLSVLDFDNGQEHTKSFIKLLTRGKTNLPSSSQSGNVAVHTKKYSIEFLNEGDRRTLVATVKEFEKGKDLECRLVLTSEPKDSMVIAHPFADKPKAFYYNQKIVGFQVEGFVKLGDKEIIFDRNNTRGILDWGRGVWTYKNTWYWGAGAGVVDGHEVGFNLGYGFGDRRSATENMLFYDGVAHKIEDVKFHIPLDERGKEKFLEPWVFTSSDGRFEMKFKPILNRHSNTDIIIVGSNQNQVFGKFSGEILLDSGKTVTIKDFVGFAEKVVNKW